MVGTAGILAFPVADFGGAQITVGRLILACAVLAISLVMSRLLVQVMAQMRNRMAAGGTALYILEKLGGYGIIVVGFVFALSSLGVNLSSLAVFAGALGIGVGLGLQGVVKEFVSGLVLLFDSIISVGDYIELPGGGTRGIVMEIGARATRIRSNDNVNILIPNSRLIEERFINWTLQGKTRRIHVPFLVAYGADKAVVRDVVVAAAKGISATLPDDETHRTQVWLVGFGESGFKFELVVWPTLDAVKRPATMHAAYTWAIDDALRAAGVEVPFPQREIRFRSLFGREGDAGLEAIGQKIPVGEAQETEVENSRNDAAQDLLRSDSSEVTPTDPTRT